jgi:hypothetical protein
MDDDEYSYLRLLFKNKIIQNNKIYDLNDENFIKSINDCKKIYNNVIFSETVFNKIQNYHNLPINNPNYVENNIDKKLFHLFKIDSIINNLYGNFVNNNCLYLYAGGCNSTQFHIVKIDDKYYDRLYLRKILPYCINYNIYTKEYYIINRNQVYIGYDDNTYFLEEIQDNKKDWKIVPVFNDGNNPTINEENYQTYIKNYQQIKKNKSLTILKNTIENFNLFEL